MSTGGLAALGVQLKEKEVITTDCDRDWRSHLRLPSQFAVLVSEGQGDQGDFGYGQEEPVFGGKILWTMLFFDFNCCHFATHALPHFLSCVMNIIIAHHLRFI